jgi:hypothetical protein
VKVFDGTIGGTVVVIACADDDAFALTALAERPAIFLRSL